MKSTTKGNLYEKEVREILEAQGWKVEGQHRKVMWIRDKFTGQMKMIMAGRDIYGCDLIAKKHGLKSRWIQVSTLSQKSAKERQVRAFSWNLDHEDLELWLRLPGKRAFRHFVAVKAASQDPTFTFAELETQLCVKRGKNEEDTDGDGGTEEKMAAEYPE